MGQESRHGFLGVSDSGAFTGCHPGVSWTAVSSRLDCRMIDPRLTHMVVGGSQMTHFQAHLCGCGRLQVLLGCWPRYQFLATWASPQSYSQHGSLLPPRAGALRKREHEQRRDREDKGAREGKQHRCQSLWGT